MVKDFILAQKKAGKKPAYKDYSKRAKQMLPYQLRL